MLALLCVGFAFLAAGSYGDAHSAALPNASARNLLQAFPNPNALPNPNLAAAYSALQAWKMAITGDPQGITATWVGPDVCNYKGVFCSPPNASPCDQLVTGIDLNHGYLTGELVPELAWLSHLALFHINTNYFCGTIPETFEYLTQLFELDVSNNRLSGPFPFVVLNLPILKYLDLRYNTFEGELPSALFDKNFDAIFVNNNKFTGCLPDNLGNSPVSVANFANNNFGGRIPASIGNMANTLNEILLISNRFEGCLPEQLGKLGSLNVFDASFNELKGELPLSLQCLVKLEYLDLADNFFFGDIPAGICRLPKLQNFTVSNNFFTSESPTCRALPSQAKIYDNRGNCLPFENLQRSPLQCKAFFLSSARSCYPRPSPPFRPVYSQPPPYSGIPPYPYP